MLELQIRVVGVHHHCWEMARFGPDGLERVMQSDDLPAAVADILASTLSVRWPERSRLIVSLKLTAPQGESVP